VLVILAVALAGALFLLWSPEKVQTTQVVSAWPSQEYVLLNSTGYVVTRRKAAVASKGTGRVQWIGPNEGDFVKAGTIVARLENNDVRASLQAAAANTAVAAAALVTARTELTDAQRNLDRANTLYGKHLVSLLYRQEAESRSARASAGLASAQAALDAARANELYSRSGVDNTEIRAPFDGTVISRSVNIGDIVTPLSSAADAKGAVLVMADMSSLEVDAEVSESSLASIHVGQPCEIVLDAFPDKRYRGVVSVIVPTVHRASATVTTKVRILDKDKAILPDMSARVSFLSKAVDENQAPVLAVNPQAIVNRGSQPVVYVVQPDGHVHVQAVTVGALLGGVRAVEGRLKGGDSVVLDPGPRLHDGSRIERTDVK
jgi:RND family efflux transporter MFP subunit